MKVSPRAGKPAEASMLVMFDHPEDATATKVIDLDPARNRTGDVRHVWIEGIRTWPVVCLSRGWAVSVQRRPSFQFQQASPGPLRHGDLEVAHLGVWLARGYDPSVFDGDSVCSMVDDDGQGIHVAMSDDEGYERHGRKIGGCSKGTEMTAERNDASPQTVTTGSGGGNFK